MNYLKGCKLTKEQVIAKIEHYEKVIRENQGQGRVARETTQIANNELSFLRGILGIEKY